MVDWTTPITVEEMYGDWPLSDDAIDDALDRSLDPVPADSLYELPGQVGVEPSDHVLDIGGRDATHGLELARRLGCRVTCLDPSPTNLAAARQLLQTSAGDERLTIGAATIEAIPLRTMGVDAIWCRDVLSHVDDLDAALTECRRVLAPGAPMILYQTFATSWLEPAERDRLVAGLAVVPESLEPERLERIAIAAGFVIERREIVGSQWREAWQEDGSDRTSRQLLHAARLIRAETELVETLGQALYKVELANALWGVYQMIGKLEPRIYVLRRPA